MFEIDSIIHPKVFLGCTRPGYIFEVYAGLIRAMILAGMPPRKVIAEIHFLVRGN